MRDSIHNSLIAFRIGVAFCVNQENYRIRVDTKQITKRFILQDEALRNLFRINADSRILLINTEGDTDPEGYQRIVYGIPHIKQN